MERVRDEEERGEREEGAEEELHNELAEAPLLSHYLQ